MITNLAIRYAVAVFSSRVYNRWIYLLDHSICLDVCVRVSVNLFTAYRYSMYVLFDFIVPISSQ